MTDFEKKEQHENDMCDARHLYSVAWRRAAAGNNPIKKWFYLGFKNAYKNYGHTLFDKIKWLKFLKWERHIETSGVKIKRDYFFKEDSTSDFGVQIFSLYNSSNWDNSYRKFSAPWWREVGNKIKELFTFDYKVCTFDYYDIFNNLIVNLTVKGLYFGLHGMCVGHKQQMHDCWEIRRKLIKAYTSESYFDYHTVGDQVFEKYGVRPDITSFNREKWLKNGTIEDEFMISSDNNIITELNPLDVAKIVKRKKDETNQDYYSRVLKKITTIEKFTDTIKWNNTHTASRQLETQNELCQEAFKCLGEKVFSLWD